MFPLLQLPFLCIQDITDQWEIIDLYKFSLLSKRAKRISKRIKANDLKVILYIRTGTLCLFRNNEMVLEMFVERERLLVGEREEMNEDIQSIIQVTQHFMDVFNCPFEIVFLELKPPLTDDQLIMMIDSLNGMVTEIRRVEIESATSSMLELFMNRFRKSIGTLVLHDSDRLVCKRLNFEIKNVFYSDSLKWINLDFLLSMDTLSISALSCNLSAKDLNVFLRSWQEGKTNQKLQHIDFMTFEQLDVMEVVKGCGGELMDPRTTKLKYQGINYAEVGFDIWIHGGIYIRRNDGRLAVIATNGHNYGGAEEIIKDIRERNYLDAWDIWNSENSAEKWNMNKFFIFIDMKED